MKIAENYEAREKNVQRSTSIVQMLKETVNRFTVPFFIVRDR